MHCTGIWERNQRFGINVDPKMKGLNIEQAKRKILLNKSESVRKIYTPSPTGYYYTYSLGS